MELKVVRTVADLDLYRDEWDLLASKAVEKNVFYERWMLVPALEHLVSLSGQSSIEIVLLRKNGELVALFPLARKRGYRGSPFSYFSFWRHIHCFLTAPLVLEHHFEEAFDALFSWMREHSSIGLVETGHYPLHTRFADLMDLYLHHRRFAFDKNEEHDRAMICSTANGDEYLKNSLKGRRMKDIRRKVNQLSQFGAIEVEELEAREDVGTWIQDFLAIEAEGWKGEEGTALINRRSEQEFFERVVSAAHELGKLRMMRLVVDGKTLAMTCDFLSGGAGFAFKICYREEFSRYSPGLLLELERVKRTLADPGTLYLDSCSSPDNIMLNRVWSERRSIESRMIGINKAGTGIVHLIKFLRLMKDTIAPQRSRLQRIKAPLENETLESAA